MWIISIRDQTACFVQSDLDLHCPQKLLLLSSAWKKLIYQFFYFSFKDEEDRVCFNIASYFRNEHVDGLVQHYPKCLYNI